MVFILYIDGKKLSTIVIGITGMRKGFLNWLKMEKSLRVKQLWVSTENSL